MFIIAEQTIILAITGLIGYIAYKLKALKHEHTEGMVKLIIKITLPLLIFTSFAGAELNSEIIKSFPYIVGASFISVFVLFVLSSLTGRLLKLDKPNLALHKVHTMFGNVAFLGFPLLNAIFPGGEGLVYAAVFQIGHDCLMWTLGILIMNKGADNKKQKAFIHLLNPTTVSFALGILFLTLKIRIPEIVFKPLSAVGHTTIYISMIYVGCVLAQVRAVTLIRNLRSYILSFNKLLLGPIIIAMIMHLLILAGLDIPENAIISSLMQAAMPCMIIISVLARDMNLNSAQAVENIFVSTILSLVSLPLVFYLAKTVFIG